ncbi:RNA polymerase I associated factor, A49-like protein [Phyllosticta citribraziliensis]|uniref:RNA polymerase I associated factor, A49-like protein n=1 Tax=Phyllosticta citribraziliensis TaxID=989973 RepID=A0ABR1LGN3_9PEZI
MADHHTEKKRKRHAQRTDRPAKKVALDAPATSVKVSFLEDDAELGPVVVATPGVSLPSSIAFNPYKKDTSDKHATTPYGLLLETSDHAKLNFTATEEQDGSADNFLAHYVGIYDPDTGELEMMEAHRLVLRSTLRSEAEEIRTQRQEAAEKQRQTNFNLRQELGREFGTKKAKKALASITENAIAPGSGASGDSVAAAVLQSVSDATSDLPTKESLQAAVDEGKPRPQANLDATNPAEVYTPESLIGTDTLRLVDAQPWIDAMQNGEAVQVHSRFVASRIPNFALQKKGLKKLKILKYILLLVDFLDALKPSRSGSKRIPPREDLEKKTGASGALLDSVRRKFANGNELTKWHVDYLITHVAAMALIVDDYEVDTFELREDLKLDNKQIAQYFHEIGCKVNNPTDKERGKKYSKAEATNHKIAKLKIPLDFPKQRNLPSKRR